MPPHPCARSTVTKVTQGYCSPTYIIWQTHHGCAKTRLKPVGEEPASDLKLRGLCICHPLHDRPDQLNRSLPLRFRFIDTSTFFESDIIFSAKGCRLTNYNSYLRFHTIFQRNNLRETISPCMGECHPANLFVLQKLPETPNLDLTLPTRANTNPSLLILRLLRVRRLVYASLFIDKTR